MIPRNDKSQINHETLQNSTLFIYLHFARLANTLLKDEESARDNHVLPCNFAKIFIDFNCFFFTHKLSNKAFLTWLLTTPPRLKYAATLRCILSLRLALLTFMFHKVV